MSIESQVNNIADLNPTYPQADDPVSQGDNHIRNIKKALKDTFPNIDGTVTASEDELNQLVGQDLPSDVSDLESRVSKNEGDIANNAAGIANNAAGIANNAAAISANTDYIKDVEVIAVNNEREIQDKADKSYVDIQNSAQDMVIAQKADKSYVDSGLGNKADKSYVDSKNNAQDAVIAQKADKTYVDAQDAALSNRISSLEAVDHSQSLNDLTDVNTSGAQENMVLTYVGGQWVPVKPMEGVMKFIQQPATVGSWTHAGVDQGWWEDGFSTSGFEAKTFSIPAGRNFVFMGLAVRGGASIQLTTTLVDGSPLAMVSTFGTVTSSPTDPEQYYVSWPEVAMTNGILVENSIVVSARRTPGGDGDVYVRGWFVEE